jgi:tRNA (adenine22-N1)-methyltransferase
LQLIADRVPVGSRSADIGSDHALLPVYLVQAGRVSFAVAGEVNPGPLEAAARQVKEQRLTDRIEVREGNGLAVLSPLEVDVITIAGMGGSLIATILEEGLEKLNGVKKLILQPNVGEEQVRRWLDSHGWYLESESILEEDGKIYEILEASKESYTNEQKTSLYLDKKLGDGLVIGKARMLQMGPYLLADAPEVWFSKWESELQKLEMIRGQLSLSSAEASLQKATAFSKEMNEIKEVLSCLQKDKQ